MSCLRRSKAVPHSIDEYAARYRRRYLLGYGDDFPDDVKYAVWMVSCPLLFGHYDEKDFPRSKSYLSATKQRVEFFSQFANYFPPGPRVGICWAGGGDIPGVDKRRSTHLDMWKPLGAIEGITWVNLQKGKGCRSNKNGADWNDDAQSYRERMQ